VVVQSAKFGFESASNTLQARDMICHVSHVVSHVTPRHVSHFLCSAPAAVCVELFVL